MTPKTASNDTRALAMGSDRANGSHNPASMQLIIFSTYVFRINVEVDKDLTVENRARALGSGKSYRAQMQRYSRKPSPVRVARRKG